MTTKQLFETLIKQTGLNSHRLALKVDRKPARIREWLSGVEIRFSDAFDICDKLNVDLCGLICKYAQDKALTNSSEQGYKEPKTCNT